FYNDIETSSDIVNISDDEDSLNVLNDNYESPNNNITLQEQVTNNNSITITEDLIADYIGTRWVISSALFNMTDKENHVPSAMPNVTEKENYIADNTTNNNEFTNASNCKVIMNKVGHVEINNTLALFVEQLKNKYLLLQEDIRDPNIAKTKKRQSGTKYEN
ncbi:11355_t:CDS:2, partial [Racocetra fulgida]